jgi:hypothetical protein
MTFADHTTRAITGRNAARLARARDFTLLHGPLAASLAYPAFLAAGTIGAAMRHYATGAAPAEFTVHAVSAWGLAWGILPALGLAVLGAIWIREVRT